MSIIVLRIFPEKNYPMRYGMVLRRILMQFCLYTPSMKQIMDVFGICIEVLVLVIPVMKVFVDIKEFLIKMRN